MPATLGNSVDLVIVAPCPVPLAIGGAERLWWGLLHHINTHTAHRADIVKLPGPERDFWEVVNSYRAFSELDLSYYDAVVSGKYPAWMTDHPCHVCYMLHPLRGLYDTYPRGAPTNYRTRHPEIRALLEVVRAAEPTREALHEVFRRLDALRRHRPRWSWRSVPATAYAFPGPLIRELVHFFDHIAFRSGAIRRFGAISEAVARREGYFPEGAEVTVAHPPSDLDGFGPPRVGRYLFTVSRLYPTKRIDLLISAMRHVKAPVELLIAGDGPDEARLRAMAAGDPRIRFLGFVGDRALVDLYAEAQAVLFVPLDEDFGLVALEAMAASKPVITTVDAGGVRELVVHGTSGYVTEPQPEAIAAHVEELLAHPDVAHAMGVEARLRAANVTWQHVTDALFEGIHA